MIATLSGAVAEKLGAMVVLDVQGIGYGVLVTDEDFGMLAIGDRTKLYIHEHIREDSHDLYGFTQLDTKRLYEQLLSVNGVGPKMALGIMSVGSTNDVRSAIARGDTKWLCQASGVGKRLAERVIVDLKDKVGLEASHAATSFLTEPGLQVFGNDEAVQALVALGYNASDAAKALSGVDTELPTEERIKLALRSKF